MGRLAPELVEQIAAANDIVEVISGYFPLKRAGSAYRASCPFHQERTPSFQVNPQRQIFKCFGCGAGGDVFRFVMDYEHVDFLTAAKKLADRAGIRIVEQELSAEDQRRYDMRQRLLALHHDAAEWFHRGLMKDPAAQPARDYLKGRGISADVAKSWRIGYAPDSWDAFGSWARAQGYSAEEIVRTGLVKLKDAPDTDIADPQSTIGNAPFYDRFRDRVIFPICNDTGEVIAFSGRVLTPDAKEAKYVNSPETMLFSKGKVLFGLYKSKRALIDKQSAIVCEGQLDLITAFEAGVQNVIAPQGTAFTEKQARILKRYIEEVVLCFDADIAGEKATARSLPHLLHENLAVRVAEMPPGEDPDSMIRGRGAEAFLAQIAAAKDFFDFQIDRLAARPDFTTPRGRFVAARKMAETISLVTDAVLRETIIHRVTLRLEISAQEFVRLLKTPQRNAVADDDDALAPTIQPLALDPTLRLLALVALRDAVARDWVIAQDWQRCLESDPDGGFVAKILAAKLNPDDPASLSGFLSSLSRSEEATVSALLDERPPEHAMLVAQDCWNELERRQIRRRMEALEARLRAPDLPVETIVMLQKEVLDLQKRLSDIARPFSPPL